MIPALLLFASLVLFLFGIRLSAFYSGCETGFYRISTMQLGIRAQHGSNAVRWLHWFSARPERFVATTLVGNNIANYMITWSLGLAVAAIVSNSSGVAELVAMMLVTPIVFVFGELIPKSLYYRAPLSLLQRGAPLFTASYFVFYPIVYPLVLLSRMTARLSPGRRRPIELMLTRTRLVNVLEAGQQEGLLNSQQSRLSENVIQLAREPASLSFIPAMSILGASEADDRDSMLRRAERLHTPRLLIHADGEPHRWMGCVRVVEILKPGVSPRNAMTPLPEFAHDTSKLEVLSELVRTGASFAVLIEQGRILGIVSRRTLLAQLQRFGPRTDLT
jgi:magnesium and cobalt exporter, CNNM family